MRERLTNIKNTVTTGFQSAVSFTRNAGSKVKTGIIKARITGKKFARTFLIILAAIGIFSMFQVFGDILTPQAAAAEPEPVVVTETFVKGELKTIGKLNTTDYTYALEKQINEPLKAFDKFDVPFTTKSLKVMFTGVVKAGYLIEDLEFATVGDTIIFAIPAKPHIENFLTGQNDLVAEDVWINQIEPSDYQMLSDEVKASGLANAEADGLYEQAEQDLRAFLSAHFEELGYQVKYTTNYI